ncbi:ladderlectin-like [Oryzias latipes]|uniref:C-type lectin domain-containing protein n=1 Tax=Oryzias latipes TaxID=8090 RepID=H2LBG1_ORYLA|nr:ladderlectin-like [Oryzias latipes]
MMAMMKLAVLVLVCAAVAQTRADAPEAASSKSAEDKVVLEKKRLLYHASWTSFGGRHFSYFPSTMTWAEAESFCRSIGGNLASVKNRFENTELLSLIKQKQGRYKPTWIGGSDAQTNGIWFWSDGSNDQYTNWCPNEPNNYFGNQKCLIMSAKKRRCWDDVRCGARRPFICAKRKC